LEHDIRWLILRDADIFPPPPHTSVVCQRDLSFEIMAGQKERRHEFVVDQHNGKNWGRVGTGHYTKWSPCPPVGMSRSPLKLSEPNKPVVIYVTLTQYFGLRIGKLSDERNWMIYADTLNDWIGIPVSYISGWLALP
jgi:hypothetical protein